MSFEFGKTTDGQDIVPGMTLYWVTKWRREDRWDVCHDRVLSIFGLGGFELHGCHDRVRNVKRVSKRHPYYADKANAQAMADKNAK